MTELPKKIKAKRDELALQWIKKDDGSVGHCPDCFKQGFDAGYAEAMKLVQPLIEALKVSDDDLWFDPSTIGGACMVCDANLHDNCMGKHAQLNGDSCPIQVIHEVLVQFKKELE